MRNQISPTIVLITIMVAIGFSGLVLWRYADTRPPAAAISAREMLASPKAQAAIMDRYSAKYGGGYGPDSASGAYPAAR